jgi:hypothetical protein
MGTSSVFRSISEPCNLVWDKITSAVDGFIIPKDPDPTALPISETSYSTKASSNNDARVLLSAILTGTPTSHNAGEEQKGEQSYSSPVASGNDALEAGGNSFGYVCPAQPPISPR